MHIRILKPLKTKKEEENHRKDGEVTAPHLIHEKTMTSLSLSAKKQKAKSSSILFILIVEIQKLIESFQYISIKHTCIR